MSQRRPDPTKWVWCVLVLSSGPAWSPVSSVTVRSPEKIPSTIETQAKFFQYRHLPTSEDFDQGHRLGNDRHFIERHERSRPAAGLFSAKVRWGDKKGGYGEHYWDLNHAGHAGKQEEEDEYYDDDDDYSEELQDYPDTEEKANNEREEYYPDASEYERSARPKRENSKFEIQAQKGERNYEEKQRPKLFRANAEPTQIERHNIDSQDNFDVDLMKMSLKGNTQRHAREYYHEKTYQPSEKNHIVLVVNHNVKNNYDGPGDRHLNKQVTPASVPRLFLESSTGRVIDRATGQAYVLQPVYHDRKYN
ncbi:uncharacterized protein [Maniola hyperantus]|uniref:uncharacterized protein isoform X2 n=1 Tax=Aphantopus hyperantus TaxID=2795564 RepID=UPI00374A36B3